MGGHLGSGTDEVHAAAREVLDYWFGTLTPEQHFAEDRAIDMAIIERFHDLRARLLATRAAGWSDDAETMLAAIIVLDQFSRNMFRGSAESYAADPLALDLVLRGIRAGWDRTLPPEQAVFLLMPLMHAEDRDMQRLSVAKFAELEIDQNTEFARKHAAVVERFGRFPSRNRVLERPSTAEESEFLSRSGAGW